MMQAQQPSSQWDYEWDYSQGLLSSDGWDKTISGTASESIVSNGLKLSSASTGYIRLSNDNYNISAGVMEVLINVPQYSTYNTDENNRICLSNGSKGITLYPNSGKWRVMNNSSPGSGTALADFVINTDYTIQLILDGGYASALINGASVLSGWDINNGVYSSRTAIWSQKQRGGYALIKSIKIRK